MKPTNRIITNTINSQERRQDKYGHDYLIVRTKESEIILVFPNQIPPHRWEQLQTGRKYEFIIIESERDINY